MGLVRDCGHFLCHVRERALGRTFRFAACIQEPSTAFVVRNPAQTRRTLRPAEGVRNGGIIVVTATDPGRRLEDALRHIASREGARWPAHLRARARALPQRSRGAPASPPRSAARRGQHRPRGQGVRGRLRGHARPTRRPAGLPLAGRGRPLLELVLPPPPEGENPHAEERCLFYVAMTRARRGAYLVADVLRSSPLWRSCSASRPACAVSGSSGASTRHPARAAALAASTSPRAGAHPLLPQLPLLPLPRARGGEGELCGQGLAAAFDPSPAAQGHP